MPRYALEVMYDGAKFHGSQVQGQTPTVQLAINNVLSTLLRKPVLSYGASRTDEGVHALCNYYHFDEEKILNPDFLYKCNAILPHSIAVKRICIAASTEFNARFDAIRRQYRYRIYFKKDPFLRERALYYPFAPDRGLLHEAAGVIKEYVQFESFSKRNAQSKTFDCTIYKSYWEEKGGELHYVVAANRFLRGMVRGLVATQLHLAREKKATDILRQIIEARDCTRAYFNVAGNGLYLEEITYAEGALTTFLDH
jgi:tRNA pseudouridine38-40 synthase